MVANAFAGSLGVARHLRGENAAKDLPLILRDRALAQRNTLKALRDGATLVGLHLRDEGFDVVAAEAPRGGLVAPQHSQDDHNSVILCALVVEKGAEDAHIGPKAGRNLVGDEEEVEEAH